MHDTDTEAALRTALTYQQSTDTWQVWFVPRAARWTDEGMYKLLGTFTDWQEADEFHSEMIRPL